MFVAREKELDKLNKRYQSDTMEFIVVYGRRRVGKTALINEFVKDKPVIYFSAINANDKDNLEMLSKAIYLYSNPDATENPVFGSFDAAFNEIGRIAQNEIIYYALVGNITNYCRRFISFRTNILHHFNFQPNKLFCFDCNLNNSALKHYFTLTVVFIVSLRYATLTV